MKVAEMLCPQCGEATLAESGGWFTRKHLHCTRSGFLSSNRCGWDERSNTTGIDPRHPARCPSCKNDTLVRRTSRSGQPVHHCTHRYFFGFFSCGWDQQAAQRQYEADEAKAQAKAKESQRSTLPIQRERDVPRCSRGCGYPAVREGLCSNHYQEWASAVIHRDSMNGRI